MADTTIQTERYQNGFLIHIKNFHDYELSIVNNNLSYNTFSSSPNGKTLHNFSW